MTGSRGGLSGGRIRGDFEIREKIDEIRKKGSHDILPPSFAHAGDGFLLPPGHGFRQRDRVRFTGQDPLLGSGS